MRILHISNSDIERDSRIQKELRTLCQLSDTELHALGVPESQNLEPTKVDGAHYHKLPTITRHLSFLPRAIRYAIGMFEFTIRATVTGRRIKPEIVHCHDTFALPAGWLLKKLLGCKLIYDAHELESNKNGQNAILSSSTLLIEKWCWKQVDLLVTVSDSITKWYTENLGFKRSVLVLNSPSIASSSSNLNDSNQGYFHHKYGLSPEHTVFIYLGILTPGRGIEICLKAFAAGTENQHAVFIGYGSLKGTIVEYANEYSNIHFHAPVPHDQVVKLASNADYGLCLIENISLSDYYCLPNKLFEYSFARLPVLASDFPEISKLVEQYSLGECCSPTIDSVHSAISRLTRKAKAGPSVDLSELSWETQGKRLIQAYSQLYPRTWTT